MKGKIDILNCAKGHAEVHVDAADPISLARSARIIEDMLRRGYVLFINGADGALIRVEKFDAEKKVYIIGDGPLYAGEVPAAEPERRNPLCGEVKAPITHPPGQAPRRGPGRPKKGTREVPMEKAHATAIPRTAGG